MQGSYSHNSKIVNIKKREKIRLTRMSKLFGTSYSSKMLCKSTSFQVQKKIFGNNIIYHCIFEIHCRVWKIIAVLFKGLPSSAAITGSRYIFNFFLDTIRFNVKHLSIDWVIYVWPITLKWTCIVIDIYKLQQKELISSSSMFRSIPWRLRFFSRFVLFSFSDNSKPNTCLLDVHECF